MSFFRKYRVVPVCMSILMALFLWDVWNWFQGLPARSVEDNALLAGVVAAVVGWFKFYVETGNKED